MPQGRDKGIDFRRLREWLDEGTLAAAWFSFLRFPKFGLYQILDRVGAPQPESLGIAAGKAWATAG